MYDSLAKRSKHHASADQEPADHNHGSAAIAIDKYTAYRSCTGERNISLSGYLLSVKLYSTDAISVLVNKGQKMDDRLTLHIKMLMENIF